MLKSSEKKKYIRFLQWKTAIQNLDSENYFPGVFCLLVGIVWVCGGGLGF